MIDEDGSSIKMDLKTLPYMAKGNKELFWQMLKAEVHYHSKVESDSSITIEG